MFRAPLIFVLLVLIVGVRANISCNTTNQCPTDTPCCSQYGQCGVGVDCLGGCDPVSSNSLDSCVPAPVCESKTYTFNNMDGITNKTQYLGDSSKTNWILDGQVVNHEDNLLLAMGPGSYGTVMASSTYMWYGNLKARLKTGRGKGVVTGFIILSGVKDEIDFEFVGASLDVAETNYYFQGIPNYEQSANIKLSDTFANWHTYEIQWTPDSMTWVIDGKVERTRYRKDTWNATADAYSFPQTPARVQLSLWPAGLPTNAPGTIEWAGGLVDWSDNATDIKEYGYYYAQIDYITVDCYNATSGLGTNLHTSYTYNSSAVTNNTVVDGDGEHILKSFSRTGTNLDAGPDVDSQGGGRGVPEASPGTPADFSQFSQEQEASTSAATKAATALTTMGLEYSMVELTVFLSVMLSL